MLNRSYVMWEVAIAVATAMMAVRSTKQAQEPSEKVPKGAIDSYVEKYGDEILSLSRAQLVLLQAEAEVNAEVESLAICGELWAILARDWQEIRLIIHSKEEAKIIRDKQFETEVALRTAQMEAETRMNERRYLADRNNLTRSRYITTSMC